jgi:glucose/arabinose dehydrogenase
MSYARFLLFLFIFLLGCQKSEKNRSEQKKDTASVVPLGSNDGSEAAISDASKSLPLSSIKMPDGFKIDVFAEVNNARSLAISPSGIIYVGNRDGDKVYAVKDSDGDFKADKRWVIASGLNMPNGVAFKDGDLYVAEVNRILKFPQIESKLSNPGEPTVVYDKYPTETSHGWKYIAFGPDGKLYVPVGAPCNICEPKDEVFASITTLDVKTGEREIYARGVRNSVGFTWHRETKQLWFTDNGRDLMGDDVPNCELNVATKKGLHFGFPYCHQGDVKDPEFGNKRECKDFVPPVQKMGTHVAPLGLKFYTGGMFPSEYKNQVIVARHGSWNRTKKNGYDIHLVKLNGNTATSQSVFASGWLDNGSQKVWGRPVDVLQLNDGSLLVSDDQANVIYRISYKK